MRGWGYGQVNSIRVKDVDSLVSLTYIASEIGWELMPKWSNKLDWETVEDDKTTMKNPIASIISEPESKTLEFKQDLSSPKPILKTLTAFANSAGGRLVLGISNKREVIGIEHPFDEEERLCNLIADAIAPRLVPNIEMTTVEGKTLLIVEVFLSGSRPHYLKSEGIRGNRSRHLCPTWIN